MKLWGRREFLESSLLAASGLALVFPHSSRAADSRVEILVNEPVAEISPNIYGHFVEHLGAVVYDGIWVGENSRAVEPRSEAVSVKNETAVFNFAPASVTLLQLNLL